MKNKGGSALFNLILLLMLAYGGFVIYTYAKIDIDAKIVKKAIVEATKGKYDLTEVQAVNIVLDIADRFGLEVDEENIYFSKDKDNIYIEITYPVEKNMIFWTLKKNVKIEAVSPLNILL